MGTLLNRRRYMGGGSGFPPDALMTIDTNPEVLAICYAQGWCANDKYMTYSEAAAVTSIGTVFYNNKNIKHFEEFEYFTSVTSIANNGFRNCTNLLILKIPTSVTTIGNDAFRSSGITHMYVYGNLTSWGNGYTFIDCQLRYLYSNSQSTIFPGGGATYIERLDLDSNVRIVGGFSGKTNLSDVRISEGVTTFNDNCFKQCSSLQSIVLPSTTSVMTHGVFNTCANLTSVTILATIPPTGVSGYTFASTPNAIVYVPSESVDTYKAASGWSIWASRIQAIPT